MEEQLRLGDLYDRLLALKGEAECALEHADASSSKGIRRRIADIHAMLNHILDMEWGDAREGDEYRCFPDAGLATDLGRDIERVQMRIAQQSRCRLHRRLRQAKPSLS